MINVEYINPILAASVSVMRDACHITATIGKPALKPAIFDENAFLILMGITGEMKGQVILNFGSDAALDIASRMCMMQLPELSDLAQSAICELCNMILGNAATLFSVKNINIDITPPTICQGNVEFTNIYSANIQIPVSYESGTVEINIAIKMD
ncbi:MAG: chemotaxis protein CheX [Lachnospiraceae bacterium]|nr:chemotaxis protein CheX [Lachnospiraceae bacterium]